MVGGGYHSGDILIFNKGLRKPRPGQEIARADTLRGARSYIAELSAQGKSFPLDNNPIRSQSVQIEPVEPLSPIKEKEDIHKAATPNLGGLILAKDEQCQQLQAKCSALQERVKDLEQQLRDARARVAELSAETLTADQINDSLLDDLAMATEGQSQLNNELDEARSELACLRIENSKMFTDFAEVVSQRDALSNNIKILRNQLDVESSKVITETPKEDIVRTPDGSTIRVYHEFPPAPKRSLLKRFVIYLSNYWLRVLIIVVFVLYLFWSVSMFLTLDANGVDITSYSDAIWAEFTKPFRRVFGD